MKSMLHPGAIFLFLPQKRLVFLTLAAHLNQFAHGRSNRSIR